MTAMPYVSKAKREIRDALFGDGLKACCRCHEAKPLSEFSLQRKNRDGLRPECKGCVRESYQVRYARDREKILARTRDYRKTDFRREWNRNYQRERQRREREALADRSRPLTCEVCGADGPVYYDHDHSIGKRRLGKFRGWLCRDCNTALGYAHDNPAILRQLADYLDRYRKGAA